jgi:hypothetical protein
LSEVSITSFLPPQAYIYKSCKGPTWPTVPFLRICLYHISTCFGQPCAHHQEN